jgi:prepilin-type N-terminal cleavage/methylation domain-containing protein
LSVPISACRRDAGFSLVELLVAMVITLIISGAIYGLMTSGQGAFRREPALTDRQDNIRIAMSLIWRDVWSAGEGLPVAVPFSVLTGPYAGSGPAGVLSPQYKAFNRNSDAIEIVSAANIPPTPLCGPPADLTVAGATIDIFRPLPTSFFPGIVMIDLPSGEKTLGIARNPGPSTCAGAGMSFRYDGLQNPPPWCRATPSATRSVTAISVVKYWIEKDADNIPNLWRSTAPSGDQKGQWTGDFGTAFGTGDAFRALVARGIEDLQVEYYNAAGTAYAEPPTLPCTVGAGSAPATADYTQLITRVTILLSGRTTNPGVPLQGATRVTAEEQATGRMYVHGQLTSTVSPRSALVHKTAASPPQWY